MPNGLPSAVESIILGLLVDGGDLYGLELVERSQGALKRGTVYVTLARMEDKGFVRAHRDKNAEGHPGLPRPRYRVTAQGARALEALRLATAALRPARGRA
jgi:DNA-binding PadR family transcriptional regulator